MGAEQHRHAEQSASLSGFRICACMVTSARSWVHQRCEDRDGLRAPWRSSPADAVPGVGGWPKPLGRIDDADLGQSSMIRVGVTAAPHKGDDLPICRSIVCSGLSDVIVLETPW
jgi:hypothetical protein